MSNVIERTNRAIIATQNRFATARNERGAVSGEYAILLVVVAAIAVVVLNFISNGIFNSLLQNLVNAVFNYVIDNVINSF